MASSSVVHPVCIVCQTLDDKEQSSSLKRRCFDTGPSKLKGAVALNCPRFRQALYVYVCEQALQTIVSRRDLEPRKALETVGGDVALEWHVHFRTDPLFGDDPKLGWIRPTFENIAQSYQTLLEHFRAQALQLGAQM